MNLKNILYIGINGLAGSGKDTVTKIFRTILSQDWESWEDAYEYYKSVYINPAKSVTYHYKNIPNDPKTVMCIAYADQLKEICSIIFGIPTEVFYMNKNNGWICINGNFEYTETCPNYKDIVTAEEYVGNWGNWNNVHHSNDKKCWMSVREILVYVGTHVLQYNINPKIFVNVVRNKINEEIKNNSNLKYAITTDIRFMHEVEFIRENNGVLIKVVRDNVKQLDNLAEHELDDADEYFDYVIKNNGDYIDLFKTVWSLVHENLEFQNITINLVGRDDTYHNYLRLVDNDENYCVYQICNTTSVQNMQYDDDNESLVMVDLKGGPTISVGDPVPNINSYLNNESQIIPYKILYDYDKSPIKSTFYIVTKNESVN